MLWPTMSSTSSEPGDGDTTKQSLLGLDAVIQVSGVVALLCVSLKSRSPEHFRWGAAGRGVEGGS